ncbi:MAG: virginiamycin B lyase family protein [bacterium]
MKGILLSLFILSVFVAPVTYADEYEFVMKLPEINFILKHPSDIAIDIFGNGYIVDKDNNCIWKLSSTGAFLTKWGSTGTENGQFNSPYGIALDNEGNIYIADTDNNRIQVFSSDGKFLRSWGTYGSDDGQLIYPKGVSVDKLGNVYVVDSGNHRIQKFSSTGLFLSKWGSEGSGNGQFNYPYDILVTSSDDVYVSDMNNHRIQKFNSNGTFITKWGSEGFSDGQFQGPCGLAVDDNGNVYVADYGNHRIQKFDSNGTFMTKWGSGGSGNGQFQGPCGLAVDSNGNIYVTDMNNNRIQKFTSASVFLTIFCGRSSDGQFLEPHELAVGNDGNIYVADTNNNRIQKFASNGSFLAKWGSLGSGNSQFRAPRGIAVDNNGNVYVADTENHRIQKFTSNGSFLAKWGSLGSGNSQFRAPRGIAVDSNGNVYVADTENHRIQKFTSSGLFLAKWGSLGSNDGQLSFPWGVAVDSSGNVYVADTANNRIQKFSNSGLFLTKWGSFGSGDGQFQWPHRVIIDNDGNIYVADTSNHRIQKFSKNGVFLTKWGTRGTDDAEFIEPRGISLDSFGNVFVADTLNHRVQIFRPTGSPNIISATIETYFPNDPNNPLVAEIGNDVNISITIGNTGNVPWNFVVSADIWDVDNNLINSYEQLLPELSPGKHTIVNWTHEASQVGEYKLQFAVWKTKPFAPDNLLDKQPNIPQILISVILTDGINDLTTLSGTSGNTILLEWTAKVPGTSNQYILRYNKVPITEANWNESIDVSDEPVPAPPGTKQSMTVTFHYPGGIYYFAIKTQYNSKVSLISNSPCARVPIQLYKGWNLVGFIQRYDAVPLADAISNISDKIISVWTYTMTGWKKYIKGIEDPIINDLVEMTPGGGYWINVTSDCVWDFGGTLDLSPLSASVHKPPFLLYGKVISDIDSPNGLNISLRVKSSIADSYILGSEPRYGEYYVLEIPIDESFNEGDRAMIYVDDTVVDDNLLLGGMGTVLRYDINYRRKPTRSELLQNYPNPFNPETWIPYQLKEDANVEIRIYTVNGQAVRTLNLGHKPAGFYITKERSAYWDGRNEAGEPVASGAYFYTIRAGDFVTTRKMVILR